MKRGKYYYAVPYGKGWTISRLLLGAFFSVASLMALGPISLLDKLLLVAIALAVVGLIVRSFFGDGVALGVGRDGIHINSEPILYLKANKVIRWDNVKRIVIWRQPVWRAPGSGGVGLVSATYICFEGEFGLDKRDLPSRALPPIIVPGHPEVVPDGLIVPITPGNFDLKDLVEAISSRAPRVVIMNFI